MRIWTPAVERLSTAELLDRSQLVGDPNSCVRILSPEDNLLLCALHTSIHGYVRPPGIRLHLDVDRIVHLVPINWDVFLQRVFALKCRHRVYLSLAIPKVLLGTPIPEEVLFTLVPSSKKCRNMLDWVAQNGFFEDDRPKFSRADFVRLELMLYDDGLLRGLAQVIFPPPAWMKQRYQTSNDWFLAYLYAKRLVAIALKWVP
ncbi:MAG: nucleotidyltransferase family protein [Chloroflexi bacterium]|nr:nucleotidyltransferase family protein [Chloroflexota bacterium]